MKTKDQVMQEELNAADGFQKETAKIVTTRNVTVGAAVLGGLYIAGMSGMSVGKVVGTAAGAVAAYYVGEKMEELTKNDEVYGIALGASTGSLIGMLCAGAGGCLSGSNKTEDKPLSESNW